MYLASYSRAVPGSGEKTHFFTNLCSDYTLQHECDYPHTIIGARIAADVSNGDWLKPLSFHPGIAFPALPEAFGWGVLVPVRF